MAVKLGGGGVGLDQRRDVQACGLDLAGQVLLVAGGIVRIHGGSVGAARSIERAFLTTQYAAIDETPGGMGFTWMSNRCIGLSTPRFWVTARGSWISARDRFQVGRQKLQDLIAQVDPSRLLYVRIDRPVQTDNLPLLVEKQAGRHEGSQRQPKRTARLDKTGSRHTRNPRENASPRRPGEGRMKDA